MLGISTATEITGGIPVVDLHLNPWQEM